MMSAVSSRLRAIAKNTVAIAEQGFYPTATGDRVNIADEVKRAVDRTRLYLPDDAVTAAASNDGRPIIAATNETALVATRRLGGSLACLVFASARNPGGGFLNGAQAQEESLVRGSALYPCLRAAGEFYGYHRGHVDLAYSDRVIYSPDVPVFRDDGGDVLAKPYPVSFLTCAAPNRSAMLGNQPAGVGEIPTILRRRAQRVLAIAAAHGHRRLVLGAWGCGVFGNEPAVVADAFALALHDQPWFDEIVFAVFDRQRDSPTYGAFQRVFG
jgi:uncharacterized protein (TIGR02452 family)